MPGTLGLGRSRKTESVAEPASTGSNSDRGQISLPVSSPTRPNKLPRARQTGVKSRDLSLAFPEQKNETLACSKKKRSAAEKRRGSLQRKAAAKRLPQQLKFTVEQSKREIIGLDTSLVKVNGG